MKRFLLHPALLVSLLFGCGSGRNETRTVRGIERVFMQDAKTYLVYVRGAGGTIRTVRLDATYNGDVWILDDVPPEGERWAIVRQHFGGGCDGNKSSVELRIRSVKDVEGGGWDHGKAGHGMTQVIE